METLMVKSICILKREVTRMHANRMRTVHYSGRLQGRGEGNVCPEGCLPRRCLPRGCLPRECLPRAVGVCLGGRLPRVWCLPRGCLADTPHPVNRMTDTCENITLPQLQTVISGLYSYLFGLMVSRRN